MNINIPIQQGHQIDVEIFRIFNFTIRRPEDKGAILSIKSNIEMHVQKIKEHNSINLWLFNMLTS